MPDLTKLQFYSGNNYLKRSSFWSQTSIAISNATTNVVTVQHDLGIIPQYIIATDYLNDGVWWACPFVNPLRGSFGATDGAPTIYSAADTVSLYIKSNSDYLGDITGVSRNVKYGIYLDSQ